MNPKVGRPKVENPKSCEVKIRLDKKMNADVLDYAQRHNVTRTEAIRRAILLLLEEEK